MRHKAINSVEEVSIGIDFKNQRWSEEYFLLILNQLFRKFPKSRIEVNIRNRSKSSANHNETERIENEIQSANLEYNIFF